MWHIEGETNNPREGDVIFQATYDTEAEAQAALGRVVSEWVVRHNRRVYDWNSIAPEGEEWSEWRATSPEDDNGVRYIAAINDGLDWEHRFSARECSRLCIGAH